MATDPMWCYEQYNEAAEYIDMLEKQRDELLAALEEVKGLSAATAAPIIDAAIASVKDKQNAD